MDKAVFGLPQGCISHGMTHTPTEHEATNESVSEALYTMQRTAQAQGYAATAVLYAAASTYGQSYGVYTEYSRAVELYPGRGGVWVVSGAVSGSH
eukprot:2649708-Prymnesium_polylepis.1